MTRRSHRNDRRRLTARERANAIIQEMIEKAGAGNELLSLKLTEWFRVEVQRALAAHARAALSRERARRGMGSR